MEIITKKLEDVTSADYNPRQITKEAMQGLMELSPEYCDMAIFRWVTKSK